ncbi:hypothetical protein CVT26_005850 [Gymnopilus dilepis]|uniref:Uncharacterized protein n=1 Tax=Gymnopilus dilepis TaxID=231916 RepID=A0A409WBP9_9AGAR|nr:hypothetical protein CVT26_005850 [Gymnopilus dilepis]
MANSLFPWDLLKAECLRLVCTQLVQASEEGGSYQGAFRRDDMIDFLRDVEERGLEPAVKKMEANQSPRKVASTPAQASPKRKSARIQEGNESENANYNTRFKGAKRVKLTKEDKEPSSASRPVTPRKPGRPRKSTQADEGKLVSARKQGATRKAAEGASSTPAKRRAGRPKKSAAADDEEEEEERPKKGRGRPKKGTNGASTSKAPVSKGKEVFAGIILKSNPSLLKRARHVQADDESDVDGEANPNGEVPEDVEDGGEDEVIIPPTEGVNGVSMGEVESAPASSNKENDPNDMVFIANETEVHGDADADAEGDDDVPQ